MRRAIAATIAAVAAPWWGCGPSEPPPPTTSTVAVTTTAPATTVAPSTTQAPTTTTTVAPTTTAAPTTTTAPSAGFVETFDNNSGLDRFRTGVFNRHGSASGSVSADHDMNCGDPTTQRTVRASHPDESFYVCRDHIMTAVGDWSGYSVAWFEPDRTFSGQTTVSWDVNVTDLGARQWWEVMIVDADWYSGEASCPHCAVQPWLSPNPAELPAYPRDAVIVGNGAFGNDVNVHYNGEKYNGWRKVCGDQYAWFDAECSSKATRVSFSVTEVDGAISIDYGGKFVGSFPGSFPDEFVVVFKDHNYTPDKDGRPVGHTWHWDDIIVS